MRNSLVIAAALAALASGMSGAAAAAEIGTNSYSGGGRCGDFDHDGKADLLLATHDPENARLSLFQRQPDGTFRPDDQISTLVNGMGDVRWFGAGDFNHDGFADLAILNKYGDVRVSLNTQRHVQDKVLDPFTTVLTGFGNRDVVFTVDADGDGYDDLFARRSGTTTTDVYRNTAAAGVAFAKPTPYLSTASGVIAQTVADVTLDGEPDVLSVTRDGRLHLRDFATGGAGTSYLLGGGWETVRDVVVNDVNGDGAPDILARRANFTDRVIAYPHSGTFDPAAPGVTYESPYVAYRSSVALDGIG